MERVFPENIAKLGFGYMRIPRAEGGVKCSAQNLEDICRLVDRFLAAGMNYVDVAYVYDGCEEAIRETLVRRHPRDSFYLANKLPEFEARTKEDLERFFNESLERCGVEYFDYYLLHALDGDNAAVCDKLDAWGFIAELKARGLIRHMGFSFHGTPEELDDILTRHPEMEFVQLQINYADWESEGVASRRCYETARRHGKPVLIMEPVKGGLLASETGALAKVLKAAAPEKSVASWALRFAAGLEGVVVVLSGMNDMAQMEDNLATILDFKPLDEDEQRALAEGLEAMSSIEQIPCTACRYCVSGCPMEINIPEFFRVYNTYLTYDSTQNTEILFKGEDLLKLTDEQMQSVRGAKISMIFQEPTTSLNPVMTIGDQIAENIMLHKKVNRMEAEMLTGRIEPEDCARELLMAGVVRVVVSLGGDGVLCGEGDALFRLPASGRPVKDATGAGDSLTAALAVGLAHGGDLAFCAALGMEAAGITMGQPGAVTEALRAIAI